MMMRRDKTRIDGLAFVAISVRLLSFRGSVFELRLRLFRSGPKGRGGEGGDSGGLGSVVRSVVSSNGIRKDK